MEAVGPQGVAQRIGAVSGVDDRVAAGAGGQRVVAAESQDDLPGVRDIGAGQDIVAVRARDDRESELRLGQHETVAELIVLDVDIGVGAVGGACALVRDRDDGRERMLQRLGDSPRGPFLGFQPGHGLGEDARQQVVLGAGTPSQIARP